MRIPKNPGDVVLVKRLIDKALKDPKTSIKVETEIGRTQTITITVFRK